MKVFYDTEFIEDGKTIDLISIGMVREDGVEYYAVNLDAPWRRIKKHEWLMANVWPSLPRYSGDARIQMGDRLDYGDPAFRTRRRIAAEVREFLLAVPLGPELWAWYGAYDHVVLCQLFGKMIDLPEGIPMWTNDLKQEVMRLGDPRLPKQAEGVHNALADARHVKAMYEQITAGAR